MSKRHFFPILGTLQTGGVGECSWRRLWATRIPSKKLCPTLLKDFWCFSGPGVGGSAVWGAPHHRALVALGRSWGKPLVWSRRSRIYEAYAWQPGAGKSRPVSPSGCCCCCIWASSCLLLLLLVVVVVDVGVGVGVVVVVVLVVVGGGRRRCWPDVGQHLGRCLPYLGPCSPYLGGMLAHAAHRLGHVGPMSAQVCPCRSLMLTPVAPSWATVGPMLAPCSPHVGTKAVHVSPILALCRPMWTLSWPMSARCWRILASILALCWPMKAQSWHHVSPMLTPRPSRCPIFRSGPRPKTQNHEKPIVF